MDWLHLYAGGIAIIFFLIGLRALVKYILRERHIQHRDATTPSPLEEKLAAALKERGIGFEREYAVSRTHIDFAFPKSKLAVECDGWRYHHTRDAKKHDAQRDAFLVRNGWHVLRLSGEEIHSDIDGCVRKIIDRL